MFTTDDIHSDEFITAVRRLKESTLAAGTTECPSAVVVSSAGKPQAVVVLPTADKVKALKTARILKAGIASDAIVVVFDARATGPLTGEAADRYRKMCASDPDYLKKRQKSGDSDVYDLMLVQRIARDGFGTRAMPYRCDSGPVEWVEDAEIGRLVCGDAEVGGRVPDALKLIMDEPSLFADAEVGRVAGEHDVPAHEVGYRVGRAALSALRSFGCLAVDLRDRPGSIAGPAVPSDLATRLVPSGAADDVLRVVKSRDKLSKVAADLRDVLRPHDAHIRFMAAAAGAPETVEYRDLAESLAQVVALNRAVGAAGSWVGPDHTHLS